MGLAQFIRANMEPILQNWEDFARSLGGVTSAMDAVALRDHAELILHAVAADLETSQSAEQQEAKSKGHALARPSHLPATAATSHGAVRAESGFSLVEMVSEYRALRASVLRLWAADASHDANLSDCYEQQIRFNEAIDEALADSIRIYSRPSTRWPSPAHATGWNRSACSPQASATTWRTSCSPCEHVSRR